MEKIAIVGDEKWKDNAFAFTAKGFRYRHRVLYSVTLGGSEGLAELVAGQSRSRSLGRSGDPTLGNRALGYWTKVQYKRFATL
jgi:hypothetical protein